MDLGFEYTALLDISINGKIIKTPITCEKYQKVMFSDSPSAALRGMGFTDLQTRILVETWNNHGTLIWSMWAWGKVWLKGREYKVQFWPQQKGN